MSLSCVCFFLTATMRVVVILAALIAAAFAASDVALQCVITRPVITANQSSYEFEVQLSAPRVGSDEMPLLVDVEISMEWGPVAENHCDGRRHDDRLQLSWISAHVPFAQYPTRCGETSPLRFAVGPLSTKRWDSHVHRVVNGAVYAPQMGIESMLAEAERLRGDGVSSLRLSWLSGSVVPLERLVVKSCFHGERATLEEMRVATAKAVDAASVPLVIPFHGCIERDETGFCSTQFGYVARETTRINRSHANNRFSPDRWTSAYWKLPEVFEAGVHANLFRARWSCEDHSTPAREPTRVHWHLNGVMSTAEYKFADSCERLVSAATASTLTAAEFEARPEVQEKLDQYASSTHITFAPYYSQTNPQFTRRSVVASDASISPAVREVLEYSQRMREMNHRITEQKRDCDDDECCGGWCDNDNCNDSNSDCWWLWVWYIVFLSVIFIGIPVVILIAAFTPCCADYEHHDPHWDHSQQVAHITHPDLVYPPVYPAVPATPVHVKHYHHHHHNHHV